MAKKHGFLLDNTSYVETAVASEALLRTRTDVKGKNTLDISLFDQGDKTLRATIGPLILSNVAFVRRQPNSGAVEVSFGKSVSCYVQDNAKDGLPGLVCGDFEAIRGATRITPVEKLDITPKKDATEGLLKAQPRINPEGVTREKQLNSSLKEFKEKYGIK